MDGLVDLEFSDVDFDELRKILRETANVDGLGDDGERAAVGLDAMGFADGAHRDSSSHRGVRVDLHDVDMEELLGDRVTLELLDQGKELLAVDVEVDERGGVALGAHEVTESFLGDGHALVAGLAVNDGGDGAISAEAAGWAAAMERAAGDFKGELLHVGIRSFGA